MTPFQIKSYKRVNPKVVGEKMIYFFFTPFQKLNERIAQNRTELLFGF